MNFTIVLDYVLLVDGHLLQAREVSPEHFERILGNALEEISDTYDAILFRNRAHWGSKLPSSITVMRLGAQGREGLSSSADDSGRYVIVSDVLPKFEPYWMAATRAGLIAEVRFVPDIDGLVMAVRPVPSI